MKDNVLCVVHTQVQVIDVYMFEAIGCTSEMVDIRGVSMSKSNVYVGRKTGSHIDSGCCSSEETNSNSVKSTCHANVLQ